MLIMIIFLILIFLSYGLMAGLNRFSPIQMDMTTMIVVSVVVAGVIASRFDDRD